MYLFYMKKIKYWFVGKPVFQGLFRLCKVYIVKWGDFFENCLGGIRVGQIFYFCIKFAPQIINT